MDKIVINKVNEEVYKETLDNGLTVFLYKKPGVIKNYAYFQTKYGAINNEFIPYGKDKYRKFPLGIAHFLEHKLFESEDNEKLFNFFEENGAYINAFTSYEKTVYYFNTIDNFELCLNKLIDFVQSPYFTCENVESEKGIIGQEIDMVNDNPNRFLYRMLHYNILENSAYKYDIAGSRSDIKEITKEDLYDCYNTFYHPKNMILTIAGDIDIDAILKLIKENQSKKEFKKDHQIKQKEYKETNNVPEVFKKYEHNVTENKYGFVYKMNFPKMDDEKKFLFSKYIDIFFMILFGPASDFEEKMVKEKVVKSYLNWNYEFLNNENFTLLAYFLSDANDDKLLRVKLEEKLKSRENMKEEFLLYKKNLLANFIRNFDYTDSVTGFIRMVNEQFPSILSNYYELLENLNYEDFIKIIDELHFDIFSEVVLEKKEK